MKLRLVSMAATISPILRGDRILCGAGSLPVESRSRRDASGFRSRAWTVQDRRRTAAGGDSFTKKEKHR